MTVDTASAADVIADPEAHVALLRDLASQSHMRSAMGVVASRHGITAQDLHTLARRAGYPDKASMQRAIENLDRKARALIDPADEPEDTKPRSPGRPRADGTPAQRREPSDVTMRVLPPHPRPETLPQSRESPLSIERLLDDAERNGPHNARRMAERLRDEIGRLGRMMAAHREKAAIAAEVERLERELAAAKQRLRGRPAKPRAAASPEKAERGGIRAWAKANGHEVADTGKLPQAVVDAYRAAHGGGG